MKKLNANHLKLIAIIAMTIDHFSDLLFPGFRANPIAIILHIIGRLTAPIMWFFVSEGFHYTHDVKKYMMRLFIFAIISHFAYCFAFSISFIPSDIFNQTSVMYPLFIAVLVLYINEKTNINNILKHILVFILVWSAFPANWSSIAVLSVIGMYYNRGNLEKQMKAIMPWVLLYGVISFFFVNKLYGIIQVFVILVYPLLKMYNGEKGKCKWMKWFFYIYYPLHLIIIGLLRIMIYGNTPLLFS
jgi:hypothetical protein